MRLMYVLSFLWCRAEIFPGAKTMDKPKRSYYLPAKLISAFDKECSKSGYVREKVVAASMYAFLCSNPETRQKMFERLNTFLHSKK